MTRYVFGRYLFVSLVIAFLIWLIVAAREADGGERTVEKSAGGPQRERVLLGADSHRRTVGFGQVRFDGAGPEKWAARYRRLRSQLVSVRRQARRERRVLLSSPTVSEAINLAAAVYGNGSTLWRKARCESGFNTFAHNGSGASGLFQFIPSTWRSTPFGSFSIWSPYANALAAGWMHEHGRGGEWVCR